MIETCCPTGCQHQQQRPLRQPQPGGGSVCGSSREAGPGDLPAGQCAGQVVHRGGTACGHRTVEYPVVDQAEDQYLTGRPGKNSPPEKISGGRLGSAGSARRERWPGEACAGSYSVGYLWNYRDAARSTQAGACCSSRVHATGINGSAAARAVARSAAGG